MAFPILDQTIKAQVSAVYVAYFGRAPDPAGLDFWIGQYEDGLAAGETPETILNDITESFRFQDETLDNFAFFQFPNLATQSTIASFVNQVFQNLFNRDAEGTADDVETGLGFWTNEIQQRLDAGINIGDIIIDIVSGAQDGEAGNDATTIANKIEVAQAYADAFVNTPGARWTVEDDLASAQQVLTGVTDDPATVTAAEEEAQDIALNDTGETFTLTNSNNQDTSGVDNLTGGAGNDTFNALLDNSFDASDQIDGAGGTDTLNVRDTTDGNETIQGNTENVEVINVRTTIDGNGESLTVDGLNLNGVQELWNDASRNIGNTGGDNQTLTFTNVGLGYTIGLRDTGVQTVVEFTGASGSEDSANFAFDGVEASEPGDGNKVDSALTADDVETLNIDASGSDSSLAALDADSAKTLNISGDASLTLSDIDTGGTLETIDASGNSGGVTLGSTANTLEDSVTAVTGTAGDDGVHLDGNNVAATDSFDGGEGTDTVEFANGTGAGAAAAVSNFESLLVTDGSTYDLSAFTNSDIAAVTVDGGNGGTVSNLADETVTFLADAGTYTLNAAAADTTINVALDNGKAEATDGIDVGATAFNTNSNVTGINITSADPNGDLDLDNGDTNSIDNVDVKSVTVDASANTAVTTGASTETLDGSASTADLTLNAAASAQAVTVTGGTGDDTITGSANDDTLTGGEGDDTVNLGTGNDTVDLGLGDDTLVAASFGSGGELNADDSVEAGDGTDTISTAALGGGATVDLTGTGSGPLSALSNFEQFRLDLTGQTGGATLQIDDATVAAFGGSFDVVVKDGDEANDTTATIDASATVLNSSNVTVTTELTDSDPSDADTNDTTVTYKGGNAVEDVTLTANGDSIEFDTTSFLSSSDSIDAGEGGDSLSFTEDTSGGSGETTSVTAEQLSGLSNVETVNVTLAGADAGDVFSITVDEAVASANADTNGVFTVTQTNTNGALTVDGSAVTGTDLALTGNANADTLTGGGGEDTLDGAGGADTLTGGAGDDDFVLATTGGPDTITDFDFGDATGSNTTNDQADVTGSSLTFNGAFDTVVQDSTGFASDEDVVIVTSQTFNTIGDVDTFYEGRSNVDDATGSDVLVLWQDSFGDTHLAQGVGAAGVSGTSDDADEYTFTDLAELNGVGISGITNTVDTGDFIV